MKFQAHRGVGTEFPENTMPAFIAAVAQGYDYIELDPAFTADGKCVIMHDKSINRTCRDKKGTAINSGELKYRFWRRLWNLQITPA